MSPKLKQYLSLLPSEKFAFIISEMSGKNIGTHNKNTKPTQGLHWQNLCHSDLKSALKMFEETL